MIFFASCSKSPEKQTTDYSLQAQVAGQLVSGNERGNGGDAIVCLQGFEFGGLGTTQTLDYYQAIISRETFVFFGGPGETEPGKISDDVFKKARLLISRIEPFDPIRAKKYRQWLSTFASESTINRTTSLIDIHDEGLIEDYPGCFLLQIAKQNPDPQSGSARYSIDGRLWDRLDADNQATLLIHEIIYRDAIALGQQSSAQVRKLVAKLMDPDFSKSSRANYVTLMNQLGL
jgi:hypothetical protein